MTKRKTVRTLDDCHTDLAEIASALRVRKQSAHKRANRESWPYEEVPHPGHPLRIYLLGVLPQQVQQAVHRARALEATKAVIRQQEEAQREQDLQAMQVSGEALAAQVMAEEEAKARTRQRLKQDNLAKFTALPDGDKKNRARARRWLVDAFWNFHRRHGGSQQTAREAFVEAVTSGALVIPKQHARFLPRHRGHQGLTEATLRRWHYDYLEKGMYGLVTRYGNRQGQTKIDTTPVLYRLVLGCLFKHPHITAKKIQQFLEAEHPDLNIVSARGIQRFKTAWITANHQLWTYITNPDHWKNVYMAAPGSQTENIVALNQLWELDSTPADWMLTDGRHSVVGVIDLYSRRLKYYVAKTSTAKAVCQVFRRAVLAWGLPDTVRTDNGQDYISDHFDRVLRDLEIDHEICIPFASEEKATIERAMRTMSHGILDLLPGFIGHSVAERKVIEARKSFAARVMQPDAVVDVELTAEELQTQLDRWCDHLYEKDGHGGLDGRSPWAVANAWTHPVRKVTNERALDALLAPVDGARTITKKGLRLDNYDYVAPELFTHVGQRTQLKLDEQDLGRVFVYIEGAFLCVAECPELLGISRRDKVAGIKAAQKKLLTQQKQQYQAFSRDVKKNIVDAVIQHRIDESATVAELPMRSMPVSTPALDQAARSLPLEQTVPSPEEALAGC